MLWLLQGKPIIYKCTWAGFLTTECSFKIMNFRGSFCGQRKKTHKNTIETIKFYSSKPLMRKHSSKKCER